MATGSSGLKKQPSASVGYQRQLVFAGAVGIGWSAVFAKTETLSATTSSFPSSHGAEARQPGEVSRLRESGSSLTLLRRQDAHRINLMIE